jgi:peptide/nickel transport system permease protein
LNFLQFFAKRAGKAFFVVIGVVVFNFLLIHLAPGDPASVMAGESGAGDAQFLAQLRPSSASTSRCTCSCGST